MTNIIDLAGTWEFRLDPEDIGTREHWEIGGLPDSVFLPGSLDSNGLGEPNHNQTDLAGLSRRVKYVGAAWYSREVEIPAGCMGKRMDLVLERVHWFSEVWIDGKPLGKGESLSAPHRFRLPANSGNRNVRITMRIDNTPHIPIGRIGHALTEWTQTNWNGVIGDISIQPAFDWNLTVKGDGIRLSGLSAGTEVTVEGPGTSYWATASGAEALEIPMDGAVLWSDTDPNLYTVTIGQGPTAGSKTFGIRRIETRGKEILLNGSPVFLRGTLECCVFPKTGYPPTDEGSWEFLISQAKAFGLNHLRFHSWCPPEAAFAVADRLGILLQVELPLWTGLWPVSSDENLLRFCEEEGLRILAEYAHHPSFVLFTLGNEIAFYGSEPKVDALIEKLRATSPNRLYSFSAQGTHLSPACDYYVQADNGKPGAENKPLRGSTWFGVGSRFDRDVPSTTVECNAAADEFDRPVISHEVAEWAIFPDVHNRDRYDGLLEARNFRTIHSMLEAKGMGDQSPAFTQASGKLSTRLYKEEIETLLRTRGLAGYQLLGLTDFPGQGTATIGMLDAFWDEKGFVDANEFRTFCAPTVPLAELTKFVWTNDERFSAKAVVFHNGPATSQSLIWQIKDANGVTVREGSIDAQTLPELGTIAFGEIQFSWSGLPAPARYELELICGIHQNHWPLWLYPASIPIAPKAEYLAARHYREDVRKALKDGKNVWLNMHPRASWSGIAGRFAPAFWSPIHFKEQVGTMGALIDSDHPIFEHFPTEFHTDWQWWDVLTKSKAINLDALPLNFRPTLQIIDRYERNLKLGSIFEAQIGNGKLFFSFLDLDDLDSRPVARQLDYAIRRYLASDAFVPAQALSLNDLDRLFASEP